MQKYAKKPVQIEAVQFLGHNSAEIIEWVEANGALHGVVIEGISSDGSYLPCLLVYVRDSVTKVILGSWVIRGVDGDFYPCADAIFRATYDIVSD